jgi:hypothetical protein
MQKQGVVVITSHFDFIDFDLLICKKLEDFRRINDSLRKTRKCNGKLIWKYVGLLVLRNNLFRLTMKDIQKY